MAMTKWLAAAALAATAPSGALAVDPAFAKNLTVFHINPHSYGAVPLNMDVGDAAGDLFFDMHNAILYPVECPEGPDTPHKPGARNPCLNPEAYGADLVVNKVTLEVDSRFSTYAKCNIGVNGTDSHGHACKDNTYCCFCEDDSRATIPCNKTIGFENVSQQFGSYSYGCDSETSCWSEHSSKKLGGEYYGGWYSPQDIGCADPTNPTDDCTWRVVSVDAIINRTCHNDRFMQEIAKKNETCFSACPSLAPTDTCAVTCFYNTVLGPGAGDPKGVVTPESGVSTEDVVQAWLAGFRDVAEGGCPRLTAHPNHRLN